MTPEEQYLFDLRGFLVVPGALSPEELSELNAIFDERDASESEPAAAKHRFQRLMWWGAAYRKLIDNPRITSYLAELIGPQFRLDHDYADLIRSGRGPTGTMLHGGGTPFDPCMFFHGRDGRMHNGLTAVAYYLRDVNPGEGGFGCVPGSHKSNYPFPDAWRNLEELQHPCVSAVAAPAGTAIIFTEALTHGTLPWRGKADRRTLFYKYSPPAISWSAHYYDANEFDDLTVRQRAILEGPNARYGGRKLPYIVGRKA
ncbi:phytanoyl-CoA dioxygenase family protein [Corallococcus carmarthensis]|uniref:Mitomycin antibiotics/polyketide fumonisin biosynthesis protein n=1 Tax=Corallococcus carmarthensis TaxID=2316728 RepID=A0A3A8JX49_9BACT|nr:phytanoyl-CoA dioxygenase family protein [Corallococcus carmarthensis]NOK18520.1 mitomycin antibiotics/polyketide fumonisin biosynthesis protein [Corallococcus carmarthensis]RKG99478.1 mitomycin antibiotics/polyketide fumonisin biosynthesis protein [Corallococcus carmarthensis]